MQLAVFIAMHCAIRSIDHLGEILKRLGKGSKLEKLRLHRTKCSKLIENVIAPDNLTELLRDVGTAKYSLIVDESTDVSTIKFMAVCIRYYSRKHKRFITDFLGIIQVVSAKGVDLSDALIEYLQKIGLILDNFHSVGTDGAPSMCGVNNSFFTHLRRRIPHLVLIKCVCHSLHKCAEHAFKRVPQHLKFILTETYNWISGSTKRLAEYVEFYKVTQLSASCFYLIIPRPLINVIVILLPGTTQREVAAQVPESVLHPMAHLAPRLRPRC